MKAGNVLLTRDRSARLCDFGLSEAKNRSKTMTSAANAGSKSNALTVAWSAPELFTAEPKSFATDVYALGLTLWEIYERATPFASMPEAAVVSQVLAGRRPKLAKTPASVRRLVEKCWSEDPKERPGADRVALMLTNLWTNHPGRQPDADESEGDERGKEPEADAKKKEAEADAKAKKEAEAKAKKEAEAEAKAKKEAEAKAKKEAEAEAKAKKEAEAKAKKEADAKAKAAASSAPASAPPDLHSRLRAWREREARELGDAPLSDVFDDKTLAKIAVAKPKTLAALGKLRGVGPEKVSAFGDDVLEIIRGEGASAAEDIDVRVE
jgi:flagellar biosynthesis GTPase FlhF